MDWERLEESLNPEPAFYVEPPDNRRDWPEIARQATFLQVMRWSAPRVLLYANGNAGKRNPRQARREGIRTGVFDLTAQWRGPLIAHLEFKGYSSAGRPGTLSDAQIGFGNRCVELGIPCACFFSPYKAVEWLREIGFPVGEVRRAA